MTPDKINPAFLTPELSAAAASNELIATRLAEISALALESKKLNENPTDAAAQLTVPEGDVEMTEAEEQEQIEANFAIAAVEAKTAYETANPGKPLDLEAIFKAIQGSTKTKESALPRSRTAQGLQARWWEEPVTLQRPRASNLLLTHIHFDSPYSLFYIDDELSYQ